MCRFYLNGKKQDMSSDFHKYMIVNIFEQICKYFPSVFNVLSRALRRCQQTGNGARLTNVRAPASDQAHVYNFTCFKLSNVMSTCRLPREYRTEAHGRRSVISADFAF